MSDLQPDDERPTWRTDEAWKRLEARISAHEASRRHPWWYSRKVSAAAAAILLTVAGYGAFRLQLKASADPEASEQVYRSVAAQRRTIQLSDGTRINLGPATTLRVRLSAHARDVELEGMALFTIAHDAARPFIVRAREARIVDIGTAFNVRAYATDTVATVTVTDGVVGVTGSSGGHTLQLAAGAAARVSRGGVATEEPRADLTAATSWTDGTLQFRDTPLQDVALELGRWFDVEVRVANRALSDRRINALYTSPQLRGVLDAIAVAADARYERHGRTVTFYPRTP